MAISRSTADQSPQLQQQQISSMPTPPHSTSAARQQPSILVQVQVQQRSTMQRFHCRMQRSLAQPEQPQISMPSMPAADMVQLVSQFPAPATSRQTAHL